MSLLSAPEQIARDPAVRIAVALMPREIPISGRKPFSPESLARMSAAAKLRWARKAERRKQARTAARRAATPEGRAQLETARRLSILVRRKS